MILAISLKPGDDQNEAWILPAHPKTCSVVPGLKTDTVPQFPARVHSGYKYQQHKIEQDKTSYRMHKIRSTKLEIPAR
jgi:hypothetical protein